MSPRPVMVFAVTVTALFFITSSARFDSSVTRPIAVALSHGVGALLNVLSVDTVTWNAYVQVRHSPCRVHVANHCVAMPAYATLIALSIAVGRGLLARIALGVAFAAAFSALNLVRISTIVLVELLAAEWTHFVHEYLWNGIFFVLMVWFVARRLGRACVAHADPAPVDATPEKREVSS